MKVKNDKEVEEKSLFEIIEAVPKKPPQLTDVNFFEVEKADNLSKNKKKKASKRHNNKPCGENSKDSSSVTFNNSETTLKMIFDSYDPSQPC